MAQQKQADGSLRYRGFLHALVTIPREEGLRAMWKGLLPRLMRIPPGQVRCSHVRWAFILHCSSCLRRGCRGEHRHR